MVDATRQPFFTLFNLSQFNFFKNNAKLVLITFFHNSSVTMQKGESQNEYFQKTKHAKFSEKRLFSYMEKLERNYEIGTCPRL